MDKLFSTLSKYQPFFADSSCFIYAFENHPGFSPLVKSLFYNVSQGKLTAFTSLITVTEVLIVPYREKNSEVINLYIDVFTNLPNLTLYRPLFQTAVLAAEIRADYNFTLSDSYQLACAQESSCKSFLTNDQKLLKFKPLKILVLEKFA